MGNGSTIRCAALGGRVSNLTTRATTASTRPAAARSAATRSAAARSIAARSAATRSAASLVGWSGDVDDESVAPRVPPRWVLRAEVDVRLLHLAISRLLSGRAFERRAVPRVPVPLKVEERERAHVAHALDVHGVRPYEGEQRGGTLRHQKDHHERRRDSADDLVEEKGDPVLVQGGELGVHAARVPAATPVLRHVVRMKRERLQQRVGLHTDDAEALTLTLEVEGARDREHSREHR
mmetsp:Transcript_47119/g.123643  ORF Transcript_47119/g.123643 Transcript_47119/m.123643 type:complete len:237 (-) Transcript_47119:1300-2010(-)